MIDHAREGPLEPFCVTREGGCRDRSRIASPLHGDLDLWGTATAILTRIYRRTSRPSATTTTPSLTTRRHEQRRLRYWPTCPTDRRLPISSRWALATSRRFVTFTVVSAGRKS